MIRVATLMIATLFLVSCGPDDPNAPKYKMSTMTGIGIVCLGGYEYYYRGNDWVTPKFNTDGKPFKCDIANDLSR